MLHLVGIKKLIVLFLKDSNVQLILCDPPWVRCKKQGH